MDDADPDPNYEEQKLRAEDELRRIIQRARNSGISDRTFDEIWNEAERRYEQKQRDNKTS